MAKFDYMAFGYSPGDSDMFVANAKMYSTEETVELCKSEYDYKFLGKRALHPDFRKPTPDDVQDAYCAFRFGLSPEWPDGCYTLVGEGERGAFPVHVIDFERLRCD